MSDHIVSDHTVSDHTVLAGWGRTLQAPCQASCPVTTALPDFAGACVYGAGRSYGDCALNPGGAALITQRLNRVQAFNPQTGHIAVEPGVTFGDLLALYLPLGFLVPVTPGTGFATIGGAVANDVHGKNHEHAGSFGQHVTALEIVLPSGTRRRLYPPDELFRATIGGLGLTGLITRIEFFMQKVPGGQVRVRSLPVPDLAAFIAAMQAHAGSAYSVGWIDGTARGAALGRGILETAEIIEGPVAPPKRPISIPLDFPGWVLNPLSVAAFNAVYFRRVPRAGRVAQTDLASFLYPLDAILHWNRIYGRRGFYQFQCVVPYAGGEAALRGMLDLIARSRQASFLAVLKRLGAPGPGYLSFPMPGYTLALDFPGKPGVGELYASLCAMARAAGGRVYLAKDALLGADMFHAMYPQLPAFQNVLRAVDPEARMASAMARRLGIYPV